MLRGSVSHGHMNADRWCAAQAMSSSVGPSASSRVGEARRARGPAGRRLRSGPRGSRVGGGRAELPRLASPWMHGRRQRAPADLDERAWSRRPPRDPRSRVGELVAEGHAALDGEAVLVALAGERDGPGVDRRPQPMVRSGRPGRRAGARRRSRSRAEGLEPRDDGRVRVGRDEDVELATRGAGDDRRGQGRVAAAGDGEPRATVGRAGDRRRRPRARAACR